MADEQLLSTEESGNIKIRFIEEEVKKSYLDYAMSVIVSRALPDVRDGMKPVHRRVIYTMHKRGLVSNGKHRKSAEVVGNVMADFHPHGDLAIYDTLARMAQDFSMRYKLVDGQGNFGSIDGDSPAAMRYTECRMAKMTAEMLQDIEKETVAWGDNYDGRLKEPLVLPAKIPQLLLNGSIGIAVGMATNIPPHNLGELCDGLVHLIDNPDAEIDEIMKFVKGPDFPTAGNIYNIEDIRSAYATGRGKIVMRAEAVIEEDKKGSKIIITEIPYQVNKSSLVAKIAELIKDKKIDGVTDLRDESDRHGIRVVLELKGTAYPNKILNQLFEHTQMQTAFHVNMLALTPELEPRIMTLIEVLQHFITHRVIIVTKRTEYELRKAKDRAHILEGLKIALDNLDEVINTIRKSKDRDDAKKQLIARFKLSVLQADAILDMRLSQLAALERQKIEDEYKAILLLISELEDLLAHPEKIRSVIKDELVEVKNKYSDPRRTRIIPSGLGKFSAEDLIPDETVVISITKDNYIKRLPVSAFHAQGRGGKGVIGMQIKDEDQVDHLLTASTHDDMLFFTNKGRVFQTRAYEIPQSHRQSKGQALVNIIQIGPNEKVTSVVNLGAKQKQESKYFFFATTQGLVKKTLISDYSNVRKTGIIAINLQSGDELRWVKMTDGGSRVVQVSAHGQAIYYDENDVRQMGRSTAGVRGMKLRTGDRVIAMDVVSDKNGKSPDPELLIVLENGFGKRTALHHFTVQQRGGIGMKAANSTDKTGKVIATYMLFTDKDDILLMSKMGQTLRTTVSTVKRLGRDTQGVTLIKLSTGDKVASVTIIPKQAEESVENDKIPLILDESTETQQIAGTDKNSNLKTKSFKKVVKAKNSADSKKSTVISKSANKRVSTDKTKPAKPKKEIKIKVEEPISVKINTYKEK